MKVVLNTREQAPKRKLSPPPQPAVRLMLGRLNEELQKRLERLNELEAVLLTDGEYPKDASKLWAEYVSVEQEANRIKGGMGALRWAIGKTLELDVDLSGAIIIPDSEIKSYERRDKKRATFGGVEVDAAIERQAPERIYFGDWA